MSTENTYNGWTYPASKQAADFASTMRYYADDNGKRYGDYIDGSISEGD